MRKVTTALSNFFHYWPVGTLILWIGALHHRLLLGIIPAGGDHQIHLYRGWLMAEQLIPSGRLTGWSHFAFAGYPAGYYYPIGGDLYLTLIRYLSFWMLDWESVYCFGLFGVVLFVPLSVYFLSRCVSQRWPAFIAAVLSTGDVGGWYQGGHVFTIIWGVWPYMLAVCLSITALRLVEPTLIHPVRKRPKLAVGLSILLALAVLTHPISAIFFVVAIPLYVASFAIAKSNSITLPQVLIRIGLISSLALALTIFWITPQITEGMEWTFSLGEPWLGLSDMLGNLLRNRLFDQFSWISWALGLLGIILGLSSGRLGPTYFAILILLLVVLAGGLGSLLAEKIQMERMAGFLKAIWFVLTAITIQRIATLAHRILTHFFQKRQFTPLQSRLPQIGMGVGLSCVFVLVLVDWSNHYAKVSRYREVDPIFWKSIVQTDNWLKNQARGPLDRVLFIPGSICDKGNILSRECRRTYDNHIFGAAPVRNGLPKVKFGFEPAALFRNLPLDNHWPEDTTTIKLLYNDPNTLTNLGIRWVVSLSPWTHNNKLTQVARFGTIRIYKLVAENSGPVTLDGPGEVILKQFSDEEIVVAVENATPQSTLHYAIAYHPDWRAKHNTETVTIRTLPIVSGTKPKLIGIPAKNGEITLRFTRPWFLRVASWSSFFAWLACIALFIVAGTKYIRDKFHHRWSG